MKKKEVLSVNYNAADVDRMNKGIKKAESIMRLVNKVFDIPLKNLDNNVYIEDGELNVCVRVYEDIDNNVKQFICDLMELASLSEIEYLDNEIDEKDTTFFSVLKD